MRLAPRLLLGCVLLLAPLVVRATVRLALPFSDHMVMQADRPLPVWGTADAKENVVVEFAGQKARAIAGADGRWRVTLKPVRYAAGHKPQVLIVRGAGNEIRVNDVLIGEVWLCSGQSNMRFTLGRHAEPRDADAPLLYPESLAASTHLRIRLLNISGGTPENQRWDVCGPATAADFSAIGYFFGTALERARDVPIGLVDIGRGGASIRTFLPLSAFDSHPAFARAFPPETRPGFASGGLFADDLVPFAPFGVRGVLWYQGESDAGRAALYPELLRSMIAEWRRVLETPTLPFVIVQLPPWERRRRDPPRVVPGVKWAELREAQTIVVQTTPNTALAVIADYGERLDIHPRRKREVGERLALVARGRVYGEAVPGSGPVLEQAEAKSDSIVLKFMHAEGGLFARGERLEDFEVAGEDGRFVPASAIVSDHNQVTVAIPPGAGIKYVRYAWHDYFEPSLFNGDGWPAAPFRTDNFPLTTTEPTRTARPLPRTAPGTG